MSVIIPTGFSIPEPLYVCTTLWTIGLFTVWEVILTVRQHQKTPTEEGVSASNIVSYQVIIEILKN